MKSISLAVLHKNNRNNLCELFETMPEKQELVNTFILFIAINGIFLLLDRGTSIKGVQAITPNDAMHEIPAACYW